MAIHLGDCPRCKAKHTTFDVWAACVQSDADIDGIDHQYLIEAFLQCRHCDGTSIVQCITFKESVVESLHRITDLWPYLERDDVSVIKFLTLADVNAEQAPQHLPKKIEAVFVEGSKCIATGCYNAAGAMFRLCLDLASKTLLPPDSSNEITSRQRKYLADRMDWLFEQKHWPESLRELATCIRHDGNDGAHDGDLGADEAHDLLEFTSLMLEKIYTEPEKIRISQKRRQERKQTVN